MARKKTPKIRINVKASISRRLREIRQEMFGEHGGPELARRLNLPARTWYNYETGVTVPAEVLLGFIEQTSTNPLWLLSGEGAKFHSGVEDQVLSDLTPVELIRKGLEKLEQAKPNDLVLVAADDLPGEAMSDFVAVGLYPIQRMAEGAFDPSLIEGHVLAYRQWLPNPRETFCVRLPDDAMHPILPSGSVVAIDRTVTDPLALKGRMVAAVIDGESMVRWLDVSGRHVMFRPNQQKPDYPIYPLPLDHIPPRTIIGQVVWSWSRFNGG
ncbi:S24 family peptidase [Isosphaeraceae bacterium EP7]